MKKILPIFILFGMILFSYKSKAQISVTSSGGTSTSASYTTFSAAITAINGGTIHTGAITMNVNAGYRQVLSSAITLTATGTSSQPIVIQKNGSGANPILVAYAGSNTASSTGTRDGIFSILGGDYITIDGIDVKDTSSNTSETTRMEYGYGMFKNSVTDGCRYNTIKNCVVTLSNATNSSWGGVGHNGSIGIAILNCTYSSATAIVPTSNLGSNSFNSVSSNTIQNINCAVVLVGYAAGTSYNLVDSSNIIGGTNSSLGNNLLNFGGATGATNPANCVFASFQHEFVCSYNTINNNTGSNSNHVSTLRGIYLGGASVPNANAWIENNTITVKSGATTSQLGAIETAFGTIAGNNIININNNNITGEYTTATTGAFYVLYNTAAPSLVNINNNTISNINYSNTANTGTGILYGIYSSSSTTAKVVAKNNTVNNFTRYGTTGGTTIGIYLLGVNETATNNTVNNLTINGAGTASIMYGIQTSGTTVVCDSNTIFDLKVNKTTGTSALYGLYNISSPTNENVNYNKVYNLTHLGTGITYGIYYFTASGTRNMSSNEVYNIVSGGSTIIGLANASSSPQVFNNKIYNIRSTSNSTSGVVVGIRVSSVGTSGFTNIYNNFISDIKGRALGNNNSVIGIDISGTTVPAYISYNTINLDSAGVNLSSTGTNFGGSGISFAGTINSTLLHVKNNIVRVRGNAKGTGTFACLRNTATGTANSKPTNITANNNIYSINAASANYIYVQGTSTATLYNGYAISGITPNTTNNLVNDGSFNTSCGLYKNFMNELSTFTENNLSNGPFTATFLPIGTSYAESNATTTTNPTITFDFNRASRGSTPDVGAMQFSGTGIDASGPIITLTNPSNIQYCYTAPQISAQITDISGVETSSGLKPRLYYKKSTESDTFGNYPTNNTAAFNGWKYVETSSTATPFIFTPDFSKLNSSYAIYDSIMYFVIAQDMASTPNVSSAVVRYKSGFCPTSVNLDPSASRLNRSTPVNAFRKDTILFNIKALISDETVCFSNTVNVTLNPSVSGIDYQWQIDTSGVYTDIVGANTINLTQYVDRNTRFRLNLKCGTSTIYTSISDTIISQKPRLLSLVGDTICGYGNAVLTATAPISDSINWYQNIGDYNTIGKGNTYNTPLLNSTKTFYTTASVIGSSRTGNIGTGTLTTSATAITPFSTSWEGSRIQYLYLASEINTLSGNPRIINKLAFDVSSASAFYQKNYTIKMGHTNATSVVSGTFLSSTFTTVYGPDSITPVPVGWREFIFTTPFIWDGVSNIVIEICHENDPTASGGNLYSTSGAVRYTATSFVSVTGRYADNTTNCGTLNGTAVSSVNRPNIRFGYKGVCESNKQSVLAVVNPAPAMTLSASINPICTGDSSLITVNTSNPSYAYTWSPISFTGTSKKVSPTVNTTYIVNAIDTSTGINSACKATDTINLVYKVRPNPITVSANKTLICSGLDTVILTSSNSVNSNQTIFDENFNTSISNWTRINNSTGGTPASAAWIQNPNGTTLAGQVINSNDNSQFISSNSDLQGSGGQTNTLLTSPAISFNNVSNAKAYYYHYFRYNGSADTAFVQTSNDSINWTTQKFYTSATVGAQNNFSRDSISLSSFSGNAKVFLRFQYKSAYGWIWALDNVSIKGDLEYKPIWSPITRLYNDSILSSPYTSTTKNRVFASPFTSTTYVASAYADNGCPALDSVKINVTQPINITTQPLSASVCTGTNHTLTVVANNAVSYQWQFNNVNIAGANSASYTISNANSSHTGNYRVIITPASPCQSMTSNIAAITVSGTQVNIVSHPVNRHVCQGASTSISVLSNNGTGYQWRKNGINILGANSATLSFSSILPTDSGTYDVIIYGGAPCTDKISNAATIKVEPTILSGTIGNSQTICSGGTISPLSFITSPSGGNGTYSLQWQESNDSISWTVISGANSNSYNPGTLTGTKFFRVQVSSGICGFVFTSAIKISLFSPVTGGSIGSSQVICSGNAPSIFSQLSASTGGSGIYTYHWQISSDSISWSNITSANSTSYASGIISSTSYFRRMTSAIGCTSASSNGIKVSVNPKPNINFTVSGHCLNDIMPLSNSSNISSGTVSYQWQFGDGTTSSVYAPSKTYTSVGNYNVKLIGTSGIGCKDSLIKTVAVATVPTPAFTYTFKCEGDSVIFNDNSVYVCGSPSTTTYLWKFGNGVSSNQRHARYKYPSPGTYTVKLILTLPSGLKDSSSQTLTFNIRSIPNFSASTECYPNSTTFVNSSTGASSVLWRFGNGTSSTTTSSSFGYQYASSGSYNARLITTSAFGCKDSITRTVLVNTKPTASFSNSNVCIGNSSTFSNSSSNASSYVWSFGDGATSTSANPSHTYASSGTYSVRLIAISSLGCSDTTSRNALVSSNPIPGFSATSACLGTATVFSNSTVGGSTYTWSYGNGSTGTGTNPSYTYPSSGSYTVSMTATSSAGCTASTSGTVIVNNAPTANFSNNSVCKGTATTFSNSSTGASAYNWTFGDGNSSTLSNPSHTYSASGSYSAKLVAISTSGCKDSISKTVISYAPPVPDFSSSSVCRGATTTFSNSTPGTNLYTWSFGDGNVSASTHPSNVYTTSGSYTTKLVATNSNGCKDSISKTVIVYGGPSLNFTANPSTICEKGTISFNNTSTGSVGYQWDFGNGMSSTQINPSTTYNNFGNYTVKLKGVSSQGCADSILKSITVMPRPKALFTASDGCTGVNNTFTTNSLGSVGYDWSFGDGSTSTLANPSKSYSNAGTYSVRLIVIAANGCRDTISKSVITHPSPSASFSHLTNLCVGNSIGFTNTSTLSSGTMTHAWNFGNGYTSGATSPSHTYPSAGTYTVTLVVNSDKGCTRTASSNITILAKPMAQFTASNACINNNITINNVSTGASSYAWTFGDGGTSTSATPSKSYSSAGNYTIRLTATGSNGCTDTTSRTVNIQGQPNVNFTANNVCLGQAINFSNSSTGAAAYNWTFGDGNSSSSNNPSHLYASSGNYTVTLNAISAFGCSGSISKTITVFAQPDASFTSNALGQCITGNSFSYTNTSSISTGSMTYQWRYGDGGLATTTNGSRSYSSIGTYPVKLMVTSNNGCKDSAMTEVQVYPAPTANFNINQASQCLGAQNFVYTDASTLSSGILYRNWTLGDGQTATGTMVNKQYSTAGSYTVTLMVNSEFGCSNSISKTVSVEATPIASFSTNDATQCLSGNSFVYTNTSSIASGTYSSQWKLGDGQTASSSNASRSYGSAGIFTVRLKVSTAAGCADSTYNTVQTFNNPSSISIIGATTTNNARTETYSTSNNIGSTYNWTVVNGTLLSNGASSVQVRWNIGSGTIKVTETNANGCSGLESVLNVTAGDVAGIGQVKGQKLSVQVMPNPSNGIVNLKTTITEPVQITVYDQLGKVVYTGTMRTETQIDLSHVAQGVYHISMISKQASTSEKIIIKH